MHLRSSEASLTQIWNQGTSAKLEKFATFKSMFQRGENRVPTCPDFHANISDTAGISLGINKQ